MVGGKSWEKGKVSWSGRGGLQMGPHPDGQKHQAKPEHIISHPSYTSDVWEESCFRDPRRRTVYGPRGVRALDRRKGGAGRPGLKQSTPGASENSLKNNIVFHLSRKYIQALASIFCTIERSRKREWHAGELSII